MSQYERNTDYLIRHKIIYRRDPITDLPSQTFDWGNFYENGTHECYNLFASRAKINTYRSLKWHLYTLWYLNPNIKENSVKESMEKAHKDSALEIFGEDVEMLNSLGENLFLAGFEGEHYKDETRIRHFNETYLKSIK